jgi:hypothetical protein
MGTGIAQLVIILSSLILKQDRSHIVFIEEPETNLHPGLLRRFVDVLRSFSSVQFVVTTHSNVLLDCISDDDIVYHFVQDKSGACSATPCKLLAEQHALLDSLGVSAGSILQANAVIWVEGPSDRLYVREWIRESAPDLLEGSDFAFGLYGGSVLSHFALETQEDAAEHLIPLLSLCRFSAVVMDSDLAPGTSPDQLSDAKKQIVEAARKTAHRKAIITPGREIENDVLPEGLLHGAAAVLGRNYDDLKGAEVTQGDAPYEEEIMAHLNTDEKSVRRKLTEKVALAVAVLEECRTHGIPLVAPAYVPDLVAFIRSAQVLETAGQDGPRPNSSSPSAKSSMA